MVEIKPFTEFRTQLEGKKVLVTGASGFVGGRLVERLIVEQGCEVRGLIRSWSKATWPSRYPVELVLGDVRDPKAMMNAVKGCEIVFHCASGGTDDQYHSVITNGTENILKACQLEGVGRLVHISTIAVHGVNFSNGANENEPYRHGDSVYADSKIEAEKLVFEHHVQNNLPVSIIRPTYVWGPRSHLFTIGPLRQMVKDSFYLVDEGQGDCHAVFIETLIDAVIAASVFPCAIGRAFIVADGYEINWRNFYDAYANMLGRSESASLSSTSKCVQLRCRLYQYLRRTLETLKGNPAPFWKKVLRRSMKELADQITKLGVMSEKDLKRYARCGKLDTSTTRKVLELKTRYTFEEAMSITEEWVMDQMACELKLMKAHSDS